MRFSPRGLGLAVLIGIGIGALVLAWTTWQTTPALAAGVTAAIVEPNDDPDSWAYDPPTLTVAVGDKVTWKNNGEDVHTVTSDDASFDSGDLSHGRTWTYAFTAPGTYTYYCAPHPWMTATVVVTG